MLRDRYNPLCVRLGWELATRKMSEFHAGDRPVGESTTWENISQLSRGIRTPKLRTHGGYALADEYAKGAKDGGHEMIGEAGKQAGGDQYD